MPRSTIDSNYEFYSTEIASNVNLNIIAINVSKELSAHGMTFGYLFRHKRNNLHQDNGKPYQKLIKIKDMRLNH